MARLRLNRAWDYLKTGLFLVLVAFAAAYFSKVAEQEYAGKPTIIDGDSVRLNGVEMRLEGIDAPELQQRCQAEQVWPCGRQSRAHLGALLDAGDVQCTGGVTDQYDRVLVRCVAGERDINAAMVRDGYAVSFGSYERLEAEARAAKRGLWRGTFDRPAQWRAAQREGAALEREHGSDRLGALVRRVVGWATGDE